MIQFNLLPDVKIAYVKAQRTKRLVMGSALIATAASLAVFVLLFATVHIVQSKNLGDLDADIKKYSQELKDIPDLNKILTIQNQLSSVNAIHDVKPVASRVFVILQQVTPADVTISDYSVDYDNKVVSIKGDAPGLDKVNLYVDTLKFAKFKTENIEAKNAFREIVLSQFARGEKGATYEITLTYDDALFVNDQKIELIIPKTVTTRSVTEQPSDIFRKTESNTNTNGTN